MFIFLRVIIELLHFISVLVSLEKPLSALGLLSLHTRYFSQTTGLDHKTNNRKTTPGGPILNDNEPKLLLPRHDPNCRNRPLEGVTASVLESTPIPIDIGGSEGGNDKKNCVNSLGGHETEADPLEADRVR